MKKIKVGHHELAIDKLIWLVSALLLLFLLLRLGTLLKQSESYFEVVEASACHLKEAPCIIDFPKGGQVTLAIKPKDFPTLVPIEVAIQLVDLPQVASVRIKLKGIDMDMGPNNTALTMLAEGRYGGNIIIPICTQSTMQWQAQVILTDQKNGSEEGAKKRRINIYFETSSP